MRFDTMPSESTRGAVDRIDLSAASGIAGNGYLPSWPVGMLPLTT